MLLTGSATRDSALYQPESALPSGLSGQTITEAEVAQLETAFDTMESVLDSIIERMDHNHSMIQDAINEIRSTRIELQESNGK